MNFFDALVRYEIGLWDHVDAELSRQGQISLGQLHALRAVARHAGRARVADVSSDIGITVGAASKLVDRLERDGFAERSPNPANRRSSLIGLTAVGREALDSASEVCRSAVVVALGDEDSELITEALHRLQSRLDELEAGRAA